MPTKERKEDEEIKRGKVRLRLGVKRVSGGGRRLLSKVTKTMERG